MSPQAPDAEYRLKKSIRNWNHIRDLFAGFAEFAMRVGGADSPVKGVATAMDGEDLVVSFAGRRLRFWLDFDRAAERGIVVVDDVTNDDRPNGKPIRVLEYRFDYSGDTGLDGSWKGGNLFLSDAGEAWELLMRALDSSLDVKRFELERHPPQQTP